MLRVRAMVWTGAARQRRTQEAVCQPRNNTNGLLTRSASSARWRNSPQVGAPIARCLILVRIFRTRTIPRSLSGRDRRNHQSQRLNRPLLSLRHPSRPHFRQSHLPRLTFRRQQHHQPQRLRPCSQRPLRHRCRLSHLRLTRATSSHTAGRAGHGRRRSSCGRGCDRRWCSCGCGRGRLRCRPHRTLRDWLRTLAFKRSRSAGRSRREISAGRRAAPE